MTKKNESYTSKHPLRFLFHSSKTLNNWFKVSPWRRTILYGIVFIALF